MGSDPVTRTEITFGYSVGYTQAFFTQKGVSPVLGVTWSYSVEGNAFPIAHMGANFRL